MNNYDDMNQKSNMIIYTTEDGLTKIETTFDEDTVWLSIDQMAELFQRDKSTISRHIKNVFSEGELQRESVVANFATVASCRSPPSAKMFLMRLNIVALAPGKQGNRLHMSCPESLVYHFCDPTAPAILAGAFFIRFRCCRRLWLPDPGGLLCVLPGSGPLSKAGKRPGFSVCLNTSFPRCGS